MSPQGTNLVLASDIPYGEGDVLVFDSFNVEAYIETKEDKSVSHPLSSSLFYLPIVGMVVTISPNLSLYKMVVLPAASNPTIRIRISFLPKRSVNNFEKLKPMVVDKDDDYRRKGEYDEGKEKRRAIEKKQHQPGRFISISNTAANHLWPILGLQVFLISPFDLFLQ
jgi:hypothetical protein